MQARPLEAYRSGLVTVGQRVGIYIPVPAVIASSPSSFYVADQTFAHVPVNSVTFAIPSGGGWTSAQWDVNHTLTNVTGMNEKLQIGTTGGNVLTPTARNADGTYAESVAASAAQLININAAAGGNLTVSINEDPSIPFINFGFQDLANSFTLTLS